MRRRDMIAEIKRTLEEDSLSRYASDAECRYARYLLDYVEDMDNGVYD